MCQKLYQQALALLARREHSRWQLQHKLVARGYDLADIMIVLDKLESQDYLSEQRFCEMIVRVRSQKGYGPRRIMAELGQQDISPKLIQAALESESPNWVTLAQAQLTKKFPNQATVQQQQQFLLYRGFTFEHIKALL